MLVALAGLEGRVDFGSVESVYDVLKSAFVAGLDYRLIGTARGESRSWNGNVEKSGSFFAEREVWNRQNGVEAEVFPFF